LQLTSFLRACDSIVNLGKWALANLFSGLIKAEAEEVAQGANATETNTESVRSASAAASTTRSPAPTFIALDRATSRRARSQSMLNNGPTTPGALMIGLATPAITPAVLPPAGSGGIVQSHGSTVVRTHGPRDIVGGLPIIPQSPAAVGSNAATPMSPSSYNAGLRSPKGLEVGGPKARSDSWRVIYGEIQRIRRQRQEEQWCRCRCASDDRSDARRIGGRHFQGIYNSHAWLLCAQANIH
jgi:hypothetical protein